MAANTQNTTKIIDLKIKGAETLDTIDKLSKELEEQREIIKRLNAEKKTEAGLSREQRDEMQLATATSKQLQKELTAQQNRVELSDGKYYRSDEGSENKEAVFRTQIRETIKAHFDKQEELGMGIKVLSLFFIDRVDNYTHEESLIRKIFVEEFERLKGNYDQFKDADVQTVHKGYFASKKYLS